MLDIPGACRIEASPDHIVFVDGTNQAYIDPGVTRVKRLSEVIGHEDRSACYRYVQWLFEPRSRLRVPWVPTESDIQEMYGRIDIVQLGDEYYLFRKASFSDDLPEEVRDKLAGFLPARDRWTTQAVDREGYKLDPRDPQKYPKECIRANIDFSDPQVFDRLRKLETQCGTKRGVLRIFAEGPRPFEREWRTACSNVSWLSDLTRHLSIDTMDATYLTDFDLSGDDDHFRIRECVVLPHTDPKWIPYVQKHMESGKLRVGSWVLLLPRRSNEDTRVTQAIAFRDLIRQFSKHSGLYLAIHAETIERADNVGDLNARMDAIFDGYVVDQPLVEYARRTTRRYVEPRVFAPHYAW